MAFSNENQPLVSNRSSDDDANSTLFKSLLCKAIAVVLGIICIVAAFDFTFVVPPGEIGIVVTFGNIEAFDPGLHFRTPFISTVTKLSAKTQVLNQEHVIPTKEGLAVGLDTSILFRLQTNKAADLYKQVGSDYIKVVIEPEASSAIRGLTSESEAKALYSSGRNIIQDALLDELQQTLGPRGIIIEAVLLKDLDLPDELNKAIELKVNAEQESAQMEFVLAKEKQEAERKTIEAQGIADFQRIVSAEISQELLQWKGIEATETLAQSTNTKIVIMGNSKDGLPVILSADTASSV